MRELKEYELRQSSMWPKKVEWRGSELVLGILGWMIAIIGMCGCYCLSDGSGVWFWLGVSFYVGGVALFFVALHLHEVRARRANVGALERLQDAIMDLGSKGALYHKVDLANILGKWMSDIEE